MLEIRFYKAKFDFIVFLGWCTKAGLKRRMLTSFQRNFKEPEKQESWTHVFRSVGICSLFCQSSRTDFRLPFLPIPNLLIIPGFSQSPADECVWHCQSPGPALPGHCQSPGPALSGHCQARLAGFLSTPTWCPLSWLLSLVKSGLSREMAYENCLFFTVRKNDLWFFNDSPIFKF